MRLCLASLSLTVAAAVACGGREDPAATTAIASERDAPPAASSDDPKDGGFILERAAPSDDTAAPFAACTADEDCVAVPRVGCCHLGWKAAVNVHQVEAYQSSFRCPTAQPICIQVYIVDRRTPRCNAVTQRCELVMQE